jgi:hypothetical protein
MKFIVAVLVSLVYLMTGTAWAQQRLSPFSATYAIYHGGSKIGESNKSFSYPSGNRYLFISEATINLLLYHEHYIERSEGDVNNDGYQPTLYSVEKNGVQVFQTQAFTQGMQDNISQSLMLSFALLNKQTPKSLEIATANGTISYAFNVIHADTNISTPLGNLQATQIRFQDEKGDQIDEWLAKKYQYLPVMIQVSKNGKLTGMISLIRMK